MIDVKKFISGFLILAAVAVISGLTLSFVGNSSGSPKQASSGITVNGAATPNSLGGFVDTGSFAGNAAEVLAVIDTSSTAAAASDPQNLTNVFADSFLNGLIAANPDGVPMTQNGMPNLAAPDTSAVADTISSNPALQDFTAPNWDAEAHAQVIKTGSSDSASAVSQYGEDLNNIFNQYYLSTNLQGTMSSKNTDPGEVAYAASELRSALADTLAVQTPPSLTGLQRNLVRVMVYQKNLAQVAAEANADPVKAALTLQGEQGKYTAALGELRNQMQQAPALGFLQNKEGKPSALSAIAGILGVETAHAQWITFDPAAFGQLVLDYVNQAIVQILKNTLVSLLQRKVLTWIQGNGTPRFVQDFGRDLVNSFASAANNTAAGYQCAPPSQVPALAFLSTPAVAPGGSDFCKNQFQSSLFGDNFANFKHGFTNFNDYMNLFTPGGNTWNIVVNAADAARNSGAQSAAAKQTQNIAQQGLKGSAVCSDGSNPDGTRTACMVNGVTYSPNPDGSCPSDMVQVTESNGGKCADGSEPTITSPGQTTNQGLNIGLGSSIQDITSAQSIAGLLNALVNSLLSSLAQSAINYATGAINGAMDSGLSGISSSTITNTTSSPQAAVGCTPILQQVTISSSTGQAQANLTAFGGAVDATCAANNNCPSTENPDGTPHYLWTAPGSIISSQQDSSSTITGTTVLVSYGMPGTYNVNVTASTDQTTAKCQVQVQPSS